MELYASDKATIPEKIEINHWYTNSYKSENILYGERYYETLGTVIIQIKWQTPTEDQKFVNVKTKYNLTIYLDYIYTSDNIILLDIYDTSILNCLNTVKDLVIYRDNYTFDENYNLIDNNEIITPEYKTKFKKWKTGVTIPWENEELCIESIYEVPNSTKVYIARISQYCDTSDQKSKFVSQLCCRYNDETAILKEETFGTFQEATKFIDTFKIAE